MRRIARHLFTLCSAASLLLAMATCALWVRSRAHIDVAVHAWPVDAALTQTRWKFHSCEGVICLSRVRCERSSGPATDVMGSGVGSFPTSDTVSSRPFSGFGPTDFRPLGFRVARSVTTDPPAGPWQRRWTHWALSVPHWFVALLLIAAPARWSASHLTRGGRRRDGRCLACGYDLRATPDRCPECGAVPKPPHNPPMQWTATASSAAVE